MVVCLKDLKVEIEKASEKILSRYKRISLPFYDLFQFVGLKVLLL